MRALRIAAGVAAVAGVLAIAGCPLTGIIPGTTPTPFPGFPSDAKLTGRFTFGGNPPPQTLTAEYKVPGGNRASEKATTDSGGYFYFKGVTPGTYQIVFDDGGEEIKDANVNTVNVYVSDPVTSPPSDLKNPQVTLDLKWEPKMKPAPGGTFDGTFTFNTIPNLDADYFISVFNSSKSAVTSDLPAPGGTLTWDKKDKDGNTLPAGNYFYQIKFAKKGKKFGATDGFYGQMKFIAFKIQ